MYKAGLLRFLSEEALDRIEETSYGLLEKPYHKDDGRAVRDSTYHPYFAGHGYASIRVDMRGTGASDGILLDEYLPQEQDDALSEIMG